MQLGMIGLGRMGANMVTRLMRAGHDCVVYDVNADAIHSLMDAGATGATSIDDMVAKLDAPRAIWLMLPASITETNATELAAKLSPGDVIINGGNSYYRDDIATAKVLAESGIDYIDAGTSGGVWGLERGYCLMIGGPDAQVERLAPIFSALAPGIGDVERTPGRSGDPTPEEQGWLHCGPSGAGHFVKMVHNGIEYGVMAAYAEGLNILANANQVDHRRDADAETSPLHNTDLRFDIDCAKVAEVWRRGSVISSWLLDLTAQALYSDPQLAGFGGRVSDSGEGRWTVEAAIEEGVPANVISAALFARFASRGNDDFADKTLSAMRYAFGGHLEKPAES